MASSADVENTKIRMFAAVLQTEPRANGVRSDGLASGLGDLVVTTEAMDQLAEKIALIASTAVALNAEFAKRGLFSIRRDSTP
jgi:hypothetical protein